MTTTTKNRKILLVEDEAIIALATKKALEQFYYDVITASSPESAIKFIKEELFFDLVLMDLDLNHEIDGIQLAQNILSIFEIPIVFLSSHNSQKFIEKTERVTSYGFIVKTSSITVVDTSIKMALRLFEAKKFLASELESHKLTTKALIEKEDNLATTLNSIGDAVIVTDIRGNITRLNPAATRLTGWNVSEAVGKHIDEVFVIFNVYSKQVVTNPVNMVLERGEIVGLANHTTLRSKDGIEYQISDIASPIRESNGNLRGAVLVFSDITEKYRQEEAIRFNENLLSESQRIAKIGSWSYNAYSNELKWSQETYNIYGVKDTDFQVTIENFLAFVHPEDLTRVIESGKRIEEGYVDGGYTDFRIKLKSGETRYLRGHSEKLPATAYSQEQMIGTVQDITDQTLETERYKFLFGITSDAVFVSDSNFIVIDVNPSYTKLMGYTKDEIIGKSLLIFIFDSDAHKVNQRRFQEAQELGKVESQWNFKTKNGDAIQVDVISYAISKNSRLAIFKKVI